MKKIAALVAIALSSTIATAHADDYAFGLNVGGVVNGVAIGGSFFGTKHKKHKKHKNYYYADAQPGYDVPPPGYGEPPGDCSFKSKMQGRVKCGAGMPPPPPDYPPPAYGGGYAPPPGNYPGVYGDNPYSHPVVVPTLCQPFYYQEFVPGYGWQVLRNYRC